MTARNDITGDAIQTKGSNDAYRSGWDRIFNQKEPAAEAHATEPPVHAKIEVVVAKAQISDEQLRQNALREEWWKYCQDNQASFTKPGETGTLVPTFEQWQKLER